MNRRDLNKLAKERDKMIDSLHSKLGTSFDSLQNLFRKLLFDNFIDQLQRDENGMVLNNSFNRNLMLKIDVLFADFYKQATPLIVTAIVGGVSKVIDFNNKYYGLMEPSAKLLPIKERVLKNVTDWLGVGKDGTAKANGYLDKIVKTPQIMSEIKDMSLRAVYGQQGWDDTRKNFREWFGSSTAQKAAPDELGKIAKYYRNYTYDLYSQIDRGTAMTYATDLKLEFAVYEGGLIETSRPFCKEHNGKVYHKTEIEQFEITKAKPPNYNPFIDLGGYGCRHHLNWISNALAFIMRSDAEEYLKRLQVA